MGGAPEKQIKEALKQRTSDRPRQFFIKVCGAIDKEYSSLYLLRPKHLDIRFVRILVNAFRLHDELLTPVKRKRPLVFLIDAQR